MFIVFEQCLDSTGRLERCWGPFKSYQDAADWIANCRFKNLQQFYYGVRVLQ